MLDCDRLYTSLKYSTFNRTVWCILYLDFNIYGWVDGGYSAIEYPFNYVLVLANLGEYEPGRISIYGMVSMDLYPKNKYKRSLNFFLS